MRCYHDMDNSAHILIPDLIDIYVHTIEDRVDTRVLDG